MSGDLACFRSSPGIPSPHSHAEHVPAIVAYSGSDGIRRYLEFFAAHIRNPNTRSAYLTATTRFFAWCERMGIRDLEGITRLHVAAYIEGLTASLAAPTVKLHLAAIKVLFQFLREPRDNPAEGVRGPKHVVRKGKTPVLAAAEARALLDSIDVSTLAGLRDRALIALMIYSFARVSAVVRLHVREYYVQGTRRWIRLHEKGGKEHQVPVHHRAEEYVDAYLAAAGITDGPLFRAMHTRDACSERGMTRFTAWEMMKRRVRAAGLPEGTTNHTCRATGITVYLENGGTIENAKMIAAHASIKTTQAYDRREEKITLDEISRIRV
jgi:site-specific recombinase XerD